MMGTSTMKELNQDSKNNLRQNRVCKTKKNLFNYTDMLGHVFLIMLLLNIILSSTNISVREIVSVLIYSKKKVSNF